MFKAAYLYRVFLLPVFICLAFATAPLRADMVADAATAWECKVYNVAQQALNAGSAHFDQKDC